MPTLFGKSDNKYYAKVQNGKKWRYFYSQAEYNAYLNKGKSLIEGAKQGLSSLIDSGRSTINSWIDNASTTVNNFASSAKKTVSNASSNLSKQAKKSALNFKSNIKNNINKTNSYLNKLKNNSINSVKSIVDKGHKYYEKVKVGLSTRYFYSKEEYESYLNKGKNTLKSLNNDFTKTLNDYVNKFEIGRDVAVAVLSGVGAFALQKATKIAFDFKKNSKPSVEPNDHQFTFDPENQTTVPMPQFVDRKSSFKELISDGKVELPNGEEIRYNKQKGQLILSNGMNVDIDLNTEQLTLPDGYYADINLKNGTLTLPDGEEILLENLSETIEDYAKFEETRDLLIRDHLSDLNIKDEYNTRDRDREVTNPNYAGHSVYNYDDWMNPEKALVDFTTNCSSCTLAYDLRRRGYDVEAVRASDIIAPDGTEGLTPDDWDQIYKGATKRSLTDIVKDSGMNDGFVSLDPMTASKLVEKDILSQGEGASGLLYSYWAQGGGHAMYYEVKDGKLIIQDPQVNETYDLFTDVVVYSRDIGYVRTDNCEPTDLILDYVQNKK